FPSQTTPQQQTYVVNSNGDITFPVIGTLHVAGMTTTQLTKMLEEKISKDVVNPIVYVRIVNFKVSVIGEVKTPGVKEVTRERFSVLDALASANDMTEYGDRSKVILIREENGKRTSHLLNLNDAATLESPYFYMRQNDVLVVEPNNIRQDNSKYNQNNSYKLQVISTVVSACSIIASLVIALAIK
ncbi:MAG: polysaccharide biosynthesis/export family protein, partial [Muribaculaceae bacterium]|nr:polysaccharide biosynthesis/export family protein [Muribaculaceae bacterium]